MRSARCLYCDQQRPCVTSSLTQVEDSQQEIERLRSEVQQVEILLEELNARRVKLLRKLNQLQPTIAVFPPETLALIFQHTCDLATRDSKHNFGSAVLKSWIPQPEEEEDNSGEYYCMQLTLCAVATQWRQIVLSTPGLWTSVDLNVRKIRKIKQQSTILRQFLQNSGQLSFSLGIHFSHKIVPSHALLHETVDQLIYDNALRIRDLRLIRPPDKWMEFMTTLPHLTEFSVKHCSWSEIRVPDGCSRVILTEIYCDVQVAMCHSLTILRLHHIPIDVCLNLLEKCLHLVEYRNRSPEVHLRDDIMPPDSPFTLDRLEIFEWHAHSSMNPIFDEAMCTFAHMPSLRTLVWGEMARGNYSYARPFFHRLPSKLSNLELVGCSVHNSRTVIDFMPDDLPAEHISLSRCKDIFEIISNFNQRSRTGSWKFPKLQSVIVHRGQMGIPDLENSVEVLEERLYGGTAGAFRLEVISQNQGERDQSAPQLRIVGNEEGIADMSAHPSDLGITANSKPVDRLNMEQDDGELTQSTVPEQPPTLEPR